MVHLRYLAEVGQKQLGCHFSDALLVQVSGLKKDLQDRIDKLVAENEDYRNMLSASAEQVRHLLSRLPQPEVKEGEQA